MSFVRVARSRACDDDDAKPSRSFDGIEVEVAKPPKRNRVQPDEAPRYAQRLCRDKMWANMAEVLWPRVIAKLSVKPNGKTYTKRHVNRRIKAFCEARGIDRNALRPGTTPDQRHPV